MSLEPQCQLNVRSHQVPDPPGGGAIENVPAGNFNPVATTEPDG